MHSKLLDDIAINFENCAANNCLTSVTHDSFKVFDRDDNCCFICTENEPNSLCFFTVKNPQEKPINFLAIDKCTLIGDRNKKCDCAIFDEAKFYFVEMKTATPSQTRKRKSDAYAQLKSTIDIFKSKVNFDSYEILALISFGKSYIIPRIDCAHMIRVKEMIDLYGGKLIEGNIIDF